MVVLIQLIAFLTQIMTPIESVFMLPYDLVLDFKAISNIYESGHRFDAKLILLGMLFNFFWSEAIDWVLQCNVTCSAVDINDLIGEMAGYYMPTTANSAHSAVFSRIPVYQGQKENIVGILLIKVYFNMRWMFEHTNEPMWL